MHAALARNLFFVCEHVGMFKAAKTSRTNWRDRKGPRGGHGWTQIERSPVNGVRKEGQARRRQVQQRPETENCHETSDPEAGVASHPSN